MIQLNSSIFITYGLLTLSLTSLWFPKFTIRTKSIQQPWIFIFAAAGLCGLYFDFLQPTGVLWIGLLMTGSYVMNAQHYAQIYRQISSFLVLTLAVSLAFHWLPGINNPKIIDGLMISADGIPYDKFFSFSSVAIALAILGFGYQRLNSLADLRCMFLQVAPITLLTLVVVMLLSLLLGYVNWEPKWSPWFWVWAWGNLFFSCIAEEAFFRGFIQKNLILWFNNVPAGKVLGVLLASTLFGLAHYAGGVKYILLATIAGIGYGSSYLFTGRLEAGIVTHFTLNSLHFLLFTYPVLSSAL